MNHGGLVVKHGEETATHGLWDLSNWKGKTGVPTIQRSYDITTNDIPGHLRLSKRSGGGVEGT